MDRISDQVILLSHGYVVAEGQIQGVRSEVKEQPMQIVVRCDRPNDLAARLVPAKAMWWKRKLARRAPCCCAHATPIASTCLLNRMVLDTAWWWNRYAPADDDVNAVYQYLIGAEGATV